MQNVAVNMSENSLEATGKVDIVRDNTTITSEKLAVSEGGKILVFENKVRMTIQPKDQAGAENGDNNANP